MGGQDHVPCVTSATFGDVQPKQDRAGRWMEDQASGCALGDERGVEQRTWNISSDSRTDSRNFCSWMENQHAPRKVNATFNEILTMDMGHHRYHYGNKDRPAGNGKGGKNLVKV